MAQPHRSQATTTIPGASGHLGRIAVQPEQQLDPQARVVRRLTQQDRGGPQLRIVRIGMSGRHGASMVLR